MTESAPAGADQIAANVRAGRHTAVAATGAALAAIHAANPLLTAADVIRDDAAMAEAKALDDRLEARRAADPPGRRPGAHLADLPLAGVPVAVKAEYDVAGLVTTHGGRANATPAEADSEVVRRLRAAGAIVVATTHMPEFGQFPFTEGAAWGATANPWDRTRSPGGSSGGSAALVAAGCVPVALGGDGGGSIRIPASCCGLVGLKPVRGRVSTAPYPDLWGPLGTVGALTRTVADCAMTYDVLRGATRVDRYAAPEPAETFVAAAAREPGPLRIGWLTAAPWAAIRTDRHVRACIAAVARALAAAGHRVEELPGRWPDAQPAFLPLFYAALRGEAARVERPDLLEARTRASLRAGVWAGPQVRLQAIRLADRMAAGVQRRFAAYDVVLTPTIACLPPRLGRLDATGSTRALLRSLPMVAFTTLANVTGHAAISVPAGVIGGLPVGVQLYAPGGDETRLLPLAAQLERLLPWGAPPPLTPGR
ncbi:MAG: amidase family protein [Austwickia sp.]|nr:amidase family protein [Austwickia sp.]